MEENKTCSECSSVFTDSEHRCVQLDCRHSYCLDCLHQLHRRGDTNCPECRASWQGSAAHALISAGPQDLSSNQRRVCNEKHANLTLWCNSCSLLYCLKCVKEHIECDWSTVTDKSEVLTSEYELYSSKVKERISFSDLKLTELFNAQASMRKMMDDQMKVTLSRHQTHSREYVDITTRYQQAVTKEADVAELDYMVKNIQSLLQRQSPTGQSHLLEHIAAAYEDDPYNDPETFISNLSRCLATEAARLQATSASADPVPVAAQPELAIRQKTVGIEAWDELMADKMKLEACLSDHREKLRELEVNRDQLRNDLEIISTANGKEIEKINATNAERERILVALGEESEKIQTVHKQETDKLTADNTRLVAQVTQTEEALRTAEGQSANAEAQLLTVTDSKKRSFDALSFLVIRHLQNVTQVQMTSFIASVEGDGAALLEDLCQDRPPLTEHIKQLTTKLDWKVTSGEEAAVAAMLVRLAPPRSINVELPKSVASGPEVKALLYEVNTRAYAGQLKLVLPHSRDNFTSCDEEVLALDGAKCQLQDFQGCLASAAAVQSLEALPRVGDNLFYFSVPDALEHNLHYYTGKICVTVPHRLCSVAPHQRPLSKDSQLLVLGVDSDGQQDAAALIMALAPHNNKYMCLCLQQCRLDDSALDGIVRQLHAGGITTGAGGKPRWGNFSTTTGGVCGLSECGMRHSGGERCVELYLP